MPWLQLSFDVTAAQAEAVSDVLEALGAEAVTMQSAGGDSVFDQIDETPGLWNTTVMSALFAADADAVLLLARAGEQLCPQPLPPYRIEMIADQDWNRAWMDRFKPLRFGRRLWIVPSWLQPPDPQGVNIILDPGMAFGTGTHPTTALCLRWLDAANLAGSTVIDYGCGSGILAIAAARLGAGLVHAVDIDPQCLEVSRENAERNGVDQRLRIGAAEALDCPPADVLLANILAGPLVQLAPRLSLLVRPGGWIVLSGLLAAQADICLAAYAPSFNMGSAQFEGDWAMLTGRRL
jgi:ribosomal protein L11 methyltransferase